MEKILIVADVEVAKRDDSEHINETVETIYILIVSAIEKLKKNQETTWWARHPRLRAKERKQYKRKNIITKYSFP